MRTKAARYLLTLILIMLALARIPQSGAVELADDAPETYVVQPGDTLWSIAGRFLRDPWQWPELWQASELRGNPDLIYPGDRLRLTSVDGQPRLRHERLVGGSDGMRVVRLSPRVRVTELEAAIPTIPIGAIAPFLTKPWVADSDQIQQAPYVVGFPDERIVAGLHDAIYVRRIDTAEVTDFQVLRQDEALRDPETNELLGYQAVLVASASLERIGDPATLRLVRTEREVAVGDRLIPALLEAPLGNFHPRPAPAGSRGRIIAVMDGVSQIGQYDVVILNRGERARIEPGHVFEVHEGGEERRDQVRDGGTAWRGRGAGPLDSEFWLGQDRSAVAWRDDAPDPNGPFPLHVEIRRERGTFIAPFERAGILMVFRTFERVSFALVLSAQRVIRVGDVITPPDA